MDEMKQAAACSAACSRCSAAPCTVNFSAAQEHVTQYALPALQAETNRFKQMNGEPAHMDYQ